MADETVQPEPVAENGPPPEQTAEEAVAAPPPAEVTESAPPAAAASANVIDQAELDALTKDVFGTKAPTAAELAAVEPETAPAAEVEAAPFAEPEFEAGGSAAIATIDLLNDVRLEMRIELGRSNMYLEDVLKLGVGSVVELDKLAGDPVDIYVSDRLIARGEVLVLNDNFCVRINDIHSPVPELEAN